MRFVKAVLFLVLTQSAFPATWYVDQTAAGFRTGRSWSDAFTDLGQITWTAFKAGDTLELAKGDFGVSWLNIGFDRALGKSNAPVTIRLASDATRRGHVKLGGINIGNKSWVTINGSLDTNFVVPKSVHNISQITNNIGIHLYNQAAQGVFSSGGSGQRLLWLHIYRSGATNLPSDQAGINFNAAVGESEVGYCWIQDSVFGDGIRVSNTKTKSWGDLSIHHNLIVNSGDDGIQCPGGVDIWCNRITGQINGFSSGHSDGIQTWGTKIRIHHNIIGDNQSVGGGYVSWVFSQFSYQLVGDYLFYGNVLMDEYRPTSAGHAMTFDAWFVPNKYSPSTTIQNVLFANNLYHSPNHRSVGFTLHYKGTSDRGTTDKYVIRNCAFFNNVVIDMYSTSSNSDGEVLGFPGPGLTQDVTYAEFPFDANVVTGPNWAFWYMGTRSERAEDLAIVSPYKKNTSRRPAFAGYTRGMPPYDFHLTAADTVARDAGIDLSSWRYIAPMIDVDIDGNPRGQNGAWDIGPYEYTGDVPPPPDDCDEIRLRLQEALETIRLMQSTQR